MRPCQAGLTGDACPPGAGRLVSHRVVWQPSGLQKSAPEAGEDSELGLWWRVWQVHTPTPVVRFLLGFLSVTCPSFVAGLERREGSGRSQPVKPPLAAARARRRGGLAGDDEGEDEQRRADPLVGGQPFV